jgi:hypothetical protein
VPQRDFPAERKKTIEYIVKDVKMTGETMLAPFAGKMDFIPINKQRREYNGFNRYCRIDVICDVCSNNAGMYCIVKRPEGKRPVKERHK